MFTGVAVVGYFMVALWYMVWWLACCSPCLVEFALFVDMLWYCLVCLSVSWCLLVVGLCVVC